MPPNSNTLSSSTASLSSAPSLPYSIPHHRRPKMLLSRRRLDRVLVIHSSTTSHTISPVAKAHSNWSVQEKELLVEGLRDGQSWEEIVKSLPGRTIRGLKIQWKSKLKQKNPGVSPCAKKKKKTGEVRFEHWVGPYQGSKQRQEASLAV